MKTQLALFIILFLPTTLFAQENLTFPPPTPAPEIRASRAQAPLRIDGRLNETAWAQANTISNFFRIEPRQGGNYLYKSQVKILYDQRNLYFGIFCKDSLGRKGIRVQDLRRDFDWGENDIFGIQLDPQNLRQYCVSFQTTPYGNQRDLQAFNDSNRDTDWNALWAVRTMPTDSGYFAEFAIPFKSLRYGTVTSNDSLTWGLTFTRLARRDYEQTVFPAIPQSFSAYRMTYAAKLKGLELPTPSANVRIEPYNTRLQVSAFYQYNSFDQQGRWNVRGSWEYRPLSFVYLVFNENNLTALDQVNTSAIIKFSLMQQF